MEELLAVHVCLTLTSFSWFIGQCLVCFVNVKNVTVVIKALYLGLSISKEGETFQCVHSCWFI